MSVLETFRTISVPKYSVVMMSRVLLLVFMLHICTGELRLLQIVFSGGHTSHHHHSGHIPPRDPYKFLWQTRPGRVAMLGMIQLFKLGQRMRTKYSDFVTLPPDQVDLNPVERGVPCTSLKECFLSGFFKPEKQPEPVPDDSSSWKPQLNLPLGMEKQPNEPELKCPKLQAAASRVYDDSEEGNRLIGQYMNLYHYWSVNSGVEIKNPTDARELYENLLEERSSNPNASLPSWAERFWPEMKRQSDIHFAWLAKDPHMQRMAAGPLLGLMIQRMERHIDGYDVQKYFVYSGRNSSLAGLLAIFGAFDGVEPSFGSTVVLELHRFGRVYYVRVIYFWNADAHASAPEVITLPGCSEYCPYEKFRLLTTGMVPVRWEQECGLWKDDGGSQGTPSLYIIGMACILLLLAS